jgi:hypothetical protein
MKNQPSLSWLVLIIGILVIFSAGAGAFWQDGGSSFPFTTLYGEPVEIFGRGIYRHDPTFIAAGSEGTDLVTLFVGLPLLAISFVLYRRGSLRGGFLLAGVLAYFFYYAASRGLATAYNNLFLVYLALFSTSTFAFVLAFTAIDLQTLPAQISSRFPRRGMGIFMIVAGLGTALIWLSDAVAALIGNRAPVALGTHTTVVTYMLDVGIIAPAAVLGGILLLRRVALGYLLATTLTIMLALVGVMVIGQTIIQLRAGIQFSPGQMIGMIGSWIIMGGIAIWLGIAALRSLPGTPENLSPQRSMSPQSSHL